MMLSHKATRLAKNVTKIRAAQRSQRQTTYIDIKVSSNKKRFATGLLSGFEFHVKSVWSFLKQKIQLMRI